MEPGDAADGPNGPTDPPADGADVDHPDDDGEETFKSAAYFPSLMIHRRLEELDGVQHWARCEGRDDGHQLDSRVHYYDREIGFLQAEADQEMIERNEATAAAFARRRQQVEKRKAHHKTVDRWSMFERWVLDRMPAEQYAQFLCDCNVLKPGLRFLDPPVALVVTYMDTLRDDPGEVFEKLMAGSIKAYLGGITSVCFEFGVTSSPVHADAVSKQLKQWKDTDGEEASESFDMEADMKTMWSACWTVSGWSTATRVENWAMFLVAIVLFARANEVTSNCPTVEDTHLPEAESQWDEDGLPKWIETGLRDWKTRTPCHKGKRYAMRIYRNYLDSRFCPVTWLLISLHYSGITSGPLFQTNSADSEPSGDAHSEGHWENTTKRLFMEAGLYTKGQGKKGEADYIKPTGVTNSGIRRSAAQWAGRCGAREIDCANNGRWKTYTEMARYMGQGTKRRKGHENDGGRDPIFSTWVWKSVAVGSESTRNEL